MSINLEPQQDGEVNRYVNPEGVRTPYFNGVGGGIYINGMANKPKDHREGALNLSFLQMTPIIGVYNAGQGTFTDLLQCLGDKYQFDGPLAKSPTAALDKAMELLKKKGSNPTRAEAMEQALSRNPASVSLFRLLSNPNHRNWPLFAHSQGNLILSNVLSAMVAVYGDGSVKTRVVHSFGSPAVNWPGGLKLQEYGFTFDPIAMLAGFDKSFSISKVGVPEKGDKGLYSHSFRSYMENDPAFVINRFRWGGWGITVSMDENGLADALVSMGTNMTRIYKIFQRLATAHSSDSDDVAVLYVQKLQKDANSTAIKGALRTHGELPKLLIKVMDEGWTSSDEKKAIEFLKKL